MPRAPSCRCGRNRWRYCCTSRMPGQHGRQGRPAASRLARRRRHRGQPGQVHRRDSPRARRRRASRRAHRAQARLSADAGSGSRQQRRARLRAAHSLLHDCRRRVDRLGEQRRRPAAGAHRALDDTSRLGLAQRLGPAHPRAVAALSLLRYDGRGSGCQTETRGRGRSTSASATSRRWSMPRDCSGLRCSRLPQARWTGSAMRPGIRSRVTHLIILGGFARGGLRRGERSWLAPSFDAFVRVVEEGWGRTTTHSANSSRRCSGPAPAPNRCARSTICNASPRRRKRQRNCCGGRITSPTPAPILRRFAVRRLCCTASATRGFRSMRHG